MTFLKGGARRRRDALEPAIVEALRARGVRTWQIGGRGLPDLLTWWLGQAAVLEVKSSGRARMSVVQARECAPWPVVRSVEKAVEAVCGVARD